MKIETQMFIQNYPELINSHKTYTFLHFSLEKAVSKGGSMQLGRGNSSNNTLDLLTGDDVNDKDNGDGWGDDDDFEDWGSLEEGNEIS